MTQETTTATLLEIFDPAMCCSTGVCGPDVDDALVTFAQDLKWIESQGITVTRYNLGQESEKFRTNSIILQRLQAEGTSVLPILMINGDIVSEGGYPDQEQLAKLTGIIKKEKDSSSEPKSHPSSGQTPSTGTSSESVFNDKVNILVAIGAAVAAGCETSLTSLFRQAEEMDITKQDLVHAMQTGLNIRQSPMQNIVNVANKLLGYPNGSCSPGGGCC